MVYLHRVYMSYTCDARGEGVSISAHVRSGKEHAYNAQEARRRPRGLASSHSRVQNDS